MEKKNYLIITVLFLISLMFRYQTTNFPFWVDEFSSANQALLFKDFGFAVFNQDNYFIEPRNITTHLLITVSFYVFGVSEWAARVPTVLAGSLIPVWVYLILRKLYPNTLMLAVSGALLTITSYFMITWSQQARGYALQQALLLACVYLVLPLLQLPTKNLSWKRFGILHLLFFAGLLTHTTFILVIIPIYIALLWAYRSSLTSIFTWKWFGLITSLLGAILLISMVFTQVGTELFSFVRFFINTGVNNNVWYYHSFLWREYALVSFLGVFGLLIISKKNQNVGLLFFLIIGSYVVFFSFIFFAVVSRYLLPIFPILLLGMAVTIHQLVTHLIDGITFFKKHTMITPYMTLVATVLIIANGHKFDIKPSQYYSVNHDFREIALIDYDAVYQLISEKGSLQDGETAVIDTWPDRLEWYLGREFQPNYVFRWENAGPMKQTHFTFNDKGEKVLMLRTQSKLVSSVEDIQSVQSKYPQGFIWIDDTSLPEDVISYAETNFTKELYLDHYPFDDNPYSIWPGTLYSWGITP